jgi:hypothetical protein
VKVASFTRDRASARPETRDWVPTATAVLIALVILAAVAYPLLLLATWRPALGLLDAALAGLFLLLAIHARWARPGPLSREAAGPAMLAAVAPLVMLLLGGVAVLIGGRTDFLLAGLALAVLEAVIWIAVTFLVAECIWPTLPAARQAPGGRTAAAVEQPPPAAGLALLTVLTFIVLGLGAAGWYRNPGLPHPAPVLVAFLLLLVALIGFARLRTLQREADVERLGMAPGLIRRWVLGAAAAAALVCLLSLALPHRETAELPRRLAERSAAAAEAEKSASIHLAPSGGEGEVVVEEPVTAPGASLLLLLLILLLMVAAGLLLRRLARRLGPDFWLTRLWRRLVAHLKARWRRLAARRLAAPSAVGVETASPMDLFLDPFEHPELLARLSPADLIRRTFHLLLLYGEVAGHRRVSSQTALEYCAGLAPTAAASSLGWTYSRVEYGDQPPGPQDMPRIREAWASLKAALLSGLSPEELVARKAAVARGHEMVLTR